MDINSIKALLKERSMTFEDLASKMGKERSVVYKTITNGNPTLTFLLKLSEALDMPLDSIINAGESDSGEHRIDGFVEVDGKTSRIRSKKDLQDLINKIQ